MVKNSTREDELQAQLIQAEKMASLGLLVAGLAHEINTPMGAIRSNNDSLVKAIQKIRDLLGPSPGEEVERLIGIAEQVCRNNTTATDRIMSIVRNLKNFARLDEATTKAVDIHEGLESTLTLVGHQFRNRIRVVKEYGDLPLVECHPNPLNQVFMNILVNAAQAIPSQGTITIRTWRDGPSVKIAIRDTGVGIPPENIAKIFDPGFTTKGVGVGTGLGLSICYTIIRDHGGSIDVESSDKGSIFTITLPLKG